MNLPDIERVYGLVRYFAEASSKYSTQELAELDRAAVSAGPDLAEEMEHLSECVAALERITKDASDDDLVEALIHIRIRTMNIATAFDNLTGELSLLFERRAIRRQGSSS